MKIILTGGGTGGHFYPIIAVSQAIRKIVHEEKLVDANLYFMAPSAYNERMLYENGIIYQQIYAGKVRRYFSLMNVVDLFKTAAGVLKAIISVYTIFPDVIFGKGGYVSFPVICAARVLGIPVVIHESDSKPGRVNAWAGKFAKRIAVSYKEAAQFFPAGKVAHTGNPIRTDIALPLVQGAREYFNFIQDIPVVLILGGSQGSQKMNDIIIESLPELVKDFYIIHQTGKANFAEVSGTAKVVLNGDVNINRYRPMPYLNDLELRNGAGAATLIISRAGSTIFEIASWGKPSIIIPIPEDVSHDQTSNAFAYASSGSASVIEEQNLTTHVLSSEMRRIVENSDIIKRMTDATAGFRYPEAASKIAREIVNIALSHYSA